MIKPQALQRSMHLEQNTQPEWVAKGVIDCVMYASASLGSTKVSSLPLNVMRSLAGWRMLNRTPWRLLSCCLAELKAALALATRAVKSGKTEMDMSFIFILCFSRARRSILTQSLKK